MWSRVFLIQRILKKVRRMTKCDFRHPPPPDSVCKRQFLLVTVGVLDVKSVVEHDGEG